MGREHVLQPSNRTLEELVPTLRERSQWVCWRVEQREDTDTKVPVDPTTCGYASVAEDATWADFETAQAVAEVRTDIEGVGFVFTDEDPFVGIDLDDCLELATPGPGVIPSATAREILSMIESYTEISPSVTGLHLIAEGAVPGSGGRSGGIELYGERRFFTMTGRHISSRPVAVRQSKDGLQRVHDEFLGSTRTESQSAPRASRTQGPSDAVDSDRIIERARNATNGEKFKRLWNGSTSGYRSHSEADMALCTILAFWTGGDPQLIDSLFRQSGLMRPKWDADRGDRTYGELTIEEARRYVDDVFDPTDGVEGGSSE